MATIEKKLDKIDTRLTEMFKEVKSVKNEVEEMGRSMDFINENFEMFKNELKEIVNENKRLLQQQVELKKECNDLRSQMEIMKMDLEILDRERLSDSLELSEVPSIPDERPVDIVKKIAITVGIKLDKEQIKSVYRMQPIKGRTNGILVVKMKYKHDRDALLKGIKNKKPTDRDLELGNMNSRIYAREVLTREARELYFKALALKRELGWKFLWTNEGKVFLREAEGKIYHIIKNLGDILKLRPNDEV